MHDLFVPQGSNPLSAVKVGNARCAKIEFDRAVRGNILSLEGDLTSSRIQIPKEDRPVSSLQLHQPLLIMQLLIPSSGQFLVEITCSSSPMSRMKLSAGTFISKADVTDAKGMAHCKVPLSVPRNTWVQIVFHISGIFSHLFNLPAARWIDCITVAGSCKLRKMCCCADEALAISSKPGGMILFAVPAYGPPVWETSVRDRSSQQEGAGNGSSSQRSQQQQQGRSPGSAPSPNRKNGAPSSGHNTPPPQQRGGGAQDQQLPPGVPKAFLKPTARANAEPEPPLTQPQLPEKLPSLKMKFTRDADGKISFVASNPEAEKIKKEEDAARRAEEERLEAEENMRKQHEEYLIRRQEMIEERMQPDCSYVRLVEPEAAPGVQQAPPTRGAHVRQSGVGASQTSLAKISGSGSGSGSSNSALPGRSPVSPAAAPRATGATTTAAAGVGQQESLMASTANGQGLISFDNFNADPWEDTPTATSGPKLIPGYIAAAKVVAQTPSATAELPAVPASNKPGAKRAAGGALPAATKRHVATTYRPSQHRVGSGRQRGITGGSSPAKAAKPPSELIINSSTLANGGGFADNYPSDSWDGFNNDENDVVATNNAGAFSGGFEEDTVTTRGGVAVRRPTGKGLVGYGVGFLDIIHDGTDSDEDGDEEEEEEE